MARKSKAEKLMTIEDQIKELVEKRDKELEQLHIEIGKYITKTWDCLDDKKLKRLITHFSDDAKLLLQEEEDSIKNTEKEQSNEEERVKYQ
ncbi:hypothetical protein [Bacillus amyloliquefaciens]|uniref:hypothetical protein n=1 Tax=Bacillus amyloliquefaciens TaxID=1390 RepID=UPI002FF92DB0